MKKLPLAALSVLVLAGLASCGTSTTTSILTTTSAATTTATSAATTATSAATTATTTSGTITPTTLTMWISLADKAAVPDIQAAFNAKYPTTPVTINATEMAEGDVGKKYTSDPDNVPDIAHVPGDVVNNLVTNSYITPYSDADVATYLGTDIPASALAVAQDADGNQYGIPFSLNTYYLYFNNTVFTDDQVSTLVKMNAAAKTAGVKTLGVDMTNGWYGQSFFMSDGDGIFKNHGTSATETYLSGTPALNAAKTIQSMYADTGAGYELGSGDDIAASLTAGTVKAFVSGSWDFAKASTAFGGDDKVGMAILPKISIGGTEVAWQTIGDYKSIVVSASSKNKALAQKLALFMGTKAGQSLRFNDNGGSTMPTSSSLNADPTFIAANKFATIVGKVTASKTFVQNTSTQMTKWWDADTAFVGSIRDNKTATETELRGYLATLEAVLLGA